MRVQGFMASRGGAARPRGRRAISGFWHRGIFIKVSCRWSRARPWLRSASVRGGGGHGSVLLARTTLLIVTLTPAAAARTGVAYPHPAPLKPTLCLAATAPCPTPPAASRARRASSAKHHFARRSTARQVPRSRRNFGPCAARRTAHTAARGPVACAAAAARLLITRCHGNIDLLGDSIFSIGA